MFQTRIGLAGYTRAWKRTEAALVAQPPRDDRGQIAARAVAGHREAFPVAPQLRRR